MCPVLRGQLSPKGIVPAAWRVGLRCAGNRARDMTATCEICVDALQRNAKGKSGGCRGRHRACRKGALPATDAGAGDSGV